MKFSEGQIKDVVALKEDLIEQIEEHQKSIEMLEKNLAILDLTLKESSFTRASQLEAKKVSTKSGKKVFQNLLRIQFQSKEEAMEGFWLTRTSRLNRFQLC